MRLPSDLRNLTSDMTDKFQYENYPNSSPYQSVNDVTNIFGADTPFAGQPDKVAALVDYVKTQNVLSSYTYSQCLSDENPQAICDKLAQ